MEEKINRIIEILRLNELDLLNESLINNFFSCNDAKYIEQELKKYLELDLNRVLALIIVYCYIKSDKAIDTIRKRGILLCYKWNGSKKCIELLFLYRLKFNLSDININYIEMKYNNLWLLDVYKSIDDRIKESIKKHIKESIEYDEYKTTIEVELLAYLEYMYLFRENSKVISKEGIIDLNSINNYSNEEIAEAIAYLLNIVKNQFEIKQQKKKWLDYKYVESQEIKNLILLELKMIKLVEYENNIDYYNYSISNSERYIEIIGNEFEKNVRIAYSKFELKRQAETVKMLRNSQHYASLYKYAEKTVEEIGEKIFKHMKERCYLNRYRIELPDVIYKTLFKNDSLNLIKVYNEEDYEIKLACHEMFLMGNDIKSIKITNNCTMLDLILFKRIFLFISFLQNIYYKNKKFKYVINSVVPVLNREQLIQQLKYVFDSEEQINEMIDLFTYDNEYHDILATPLISSGKCYFVMPALISSTNLTRNAIVMQRRKNVQNLNSDGTNDRLVIAIYNLLNEKCNWFSVVKNLKYEYNNRSGEIDILMWDDEDIYIIEAKNPILPTNVYEMKNTIEYINKGKSQLMFAKEAMQDEQFVSKYSNLLNMEIKQRRVQCVLIMGNRFFSTFGDEDYVIRSFYELNKILDDGIIESDFGRWRYWEKEKFSINDVKKFFSKDDLLSLCLNESMEPCKYFFNIDTKTINYHSFCYNPSVHFALMNEQMTKLI